MKLGGTIAAILLFVGTTALAQDMGWYAGIAVGQSRADIDEARADQDLRSAGLTHNGIRSEDSDTGYKVLLGNRFHRNFAAEASFINLGKVSAETTVTSTIPNVSVRGEAESEQAFAFDALVIAPLDQFDLFGRAGAYYAKTKGTVMVAGGVFNQSDSDSNTGLHLGLGTNFHVAKNVSIRGEWERFFEVGGNNTGEERDVDLISIGLLFRF